VLDNRALKRLKMKAARKKLHDSSPRMIRVIESRMMVLAGHVARIGKKINAYGISVEGSLNKL
jgi:hypothetical protein